MTSSAQTRSESDAVADHPSPAAGPAGRATDTTTHAAAAAGIDAGTDAGTATHPDIDGLSFPRLSARTGRFSHGTPVVVGFAADPATVVFLRSRSGTDRTGLLWALDVAGGRERLLVDPDELLGTAAESLSVAERSRRERSRQSGAGIVAASLDRVGATVVFGLSSRLFAVGVQAGGVRELASQAPVIDPRVDPTGRHVAYVGEGGLRLSAVDGSGDRQLLAPDGPEVSWGVAEFVAAEEMGRHRGFWWSPDGESLLVARVDDGPVAVRTVADPAQPTEPPRFERYPFAGTANAAVSLWCVAVETGVAVRVEWDADAYPYLATASWETGHPPLLSVQSRDQRRQLVLAVDLTADGAVATREVGRDTDRDWIELVPGTPAWAPDGRVVTVVADRETDTYRLAADGVPFSPPQLQIAAVLDVDTDVLAVTQPDPTVTGVTRVGYDGTLTPLTATDAVYSARRGSGLVAVSRSGLDRSATTVTVRSADRVDDPGVAVGSLAVEPPTLPAPRLLELGPDRLRGWLLLPGDGGDDQTGGAGAGTLPVLLDPYGGPGHAEVVSSARRLLESQWWADQGFAVLVVDNRGTPGRGPAFVRSVRGDFAGVTLDDQVVALEAAAAQFPVLDLGRVAMRGWSFGGYLSALAVLRRPDVFSAAVAGAPPTDWHLYDTHYTERYLGHPDDAGGIYERNDLLHLAPQLVRPLMLIHGLADDNVLVAHSLRLSQALLQAGRPHVFLPLSGITHMASAEDVAENLLLLQLAFLRDSLSRPAD